MRPKERRQRMKGRKEKDSIERVDTGVVEKLEDAFLNSSSSPGDDDLGPLPRTVRLGPQLDISATFWSSCGCREIYQRRISSSADDKIQEMAGASDKARYYLEQYVPELQEYERKGIFASEEITSIASKRSDFEHVLNARGSKPSDYARYATYEMNLDRLRKKRSKRLGVKSTAFSGQRTIFFILDRATKKFPGDMGLWMQYIQFCQQEKANKKLAKIFTSVLRLKPREWGLWVLAAKHYAEGQGDMSTARSYMQRGLRFCKDEKRLWLEYLRLEMVYLAKLTARRRILGFDERKDTVTEEVDNTEDFLGLPEAKAEVLQSENGTEPVSPALDSLQKLASTPLYTGRIPIVIFDAAMQQFHDQAGIAESFFELITLFDQVPASRDILQHILEHMQIHHPASAESIICEARLSLFGIDALGTDFPGALGQGLAVINQGLKSEDAMIQQKMLQGGVALLLPYLQLQSELDADVVAVLESSIRRYARMLRLVRPDELHQDALQSLMRQWNDEEERKGSVELLQQYSDVR